MQVNNWLKRGKVNRWEIISREEMMLEMVNIRTGEVRSTRKKYHYIQYIQMKL